MKIVTATVEFSRTVKPADYESKGAKVSLTIVPTDEESFLTPADIDTAKELAKSKALEMVGVKATAAEIAKADTQKQAYAEKAEPAPKKTTAKKAAAPVVEEDVIPMTTVTKNAEPVDDLAAELEGLDTGEAEIVEPTYTPDDLTKAVHAKVQELKQAGDEKAPTKVGAVLAKFNKTGAKQFSEVCKGIVAEGKAPDFLKELSAVS